MEQENQDVAVADERLPYEKPTIATMEVTLAHLTASQGCSDATPITGNLT